MTDPNRGEGAPPSHVHIGKTEKKTNWLAWIALALGILALLLALSRCDRDEEAVAVAPTPTPAASPVDVVAATPGAAGATALAGTAALGGYLAGSEPAPRSFQFDRLNFDTAGSGIRPADAQELNAVATALQQYDAARVRIVGYADARGPSDANATLGKARADAVKAALVERGIDADRIETVSGGEADPIDDNATVSGQAENRRTELVVTAR